MFFSIDDHLPIVFILYYQAPPVWSYAFFHFFFSNTVFVIFLGPFCSKARAISTFFAVLATCISIILFRNFVFHHCCLPLFYYFLFLSFFPHLCWRFVSLSAFSSRRFLFFFYIVNKIFGYLLLFLNIFFPLSKKEFYILFHSTCVFFWGRIAHCYLFLMSSLYSIIASWAEVRRRKKEIKL